MLTFKEIYSLIDILKSLSKIEVESIINETMNVVIIQKFLIL